MPITSDDYGGRSNYKIFYKRGTVSAVPLYLMGNINIDVMISSKNGILSITGVTINTNA